MQTTPTDEVGDATAQVVEYVVALFSDSDTRDVENERDYLEGTVEALASERAARRRALDAIREALARLESADGAASVARRRLITAVQHDEAISPIYRGLICEALGAIDDADFGALALEPNLLRGVPIVYPRVEFERGRCSFQTTIMLQSLLSASAWAEFNASKERASIPVPPSKIKDGLLGWMRQKGVEVLHVHADAYFFGGRRVMWTRAEADEFERVTGEYPYRIPYRTGDAESRADCIELVDLLSDDGERRGVLPYMRGVNEPALVDSFWRPVASRGDEGVLRAQIALARVYTNKSAFKRVKWGQPRLG